MEYAVYILFSPSIGRYYAGQTNDVSIRLEKHNAGEVKSTKHGTPWQLVCTVDLNTRSEAMILEKKIKKRGIQRWLSDNNLPTI